MYYKATIVRHTEELEYCPKEEAYIGCNPDTFQDHGVIDEMEAPTKEELKKKLESQYGELEYDIDNRYQFSCDLEYHYSVPKEEQVPAIDTYEFYITEVTETDCKL